MCLYSQVGAGGGTEGAAECHGGGAAQLHDPDREGEGQPRRVLITVAKDLSCVCAQLHAREGDCGSCCCLFLCVAISPDGKGLTPFIVPVSSVPPVPQEMIRNAGRAPTQEDVRLDLWAALGEPAPGLRKALGFLFLCASCPAAADAVLFKRC